MGGLEGFSALLSVAPVAISSIGAAAILGGMTFGPVAMRNRLFTREDAFHAHKLLAFCCLLSFLYRFAQVGEATDMAFGTSDTPIVVGMHALLSLSSLPFKIPEKRIASGDRIWPEYRLHSITFACRSLACMTLTWGEAQLGVQQPFYIGNAIIVLATMAAADLSSLSIGARFRTRSIRDLGVDQRVKFFFSMMQMYATATCVVGLRRFSTQYWYVFVVQITAFFMTLRRKNLLSHTAIVVAYGSVLLMSAAVVAYEHMLAGGGASPTLLLLIVTVGNLAGILRIGFSVSKYLLWAALAAVVSLCRETASGGSERLGAWVVVCLVSMLGVVKLSGGYTVQAQDNKREHVAASQQRVHDASRDKIEDQ